MNDLRKTQFLLLIVLGVFSPNGDVFVNIDISISVTVVGAALLLVILNK